MAACATQVEADGCIVSRRQWVHWLECHQSEIMNCSWPPTGDTGSAKVKTNHSVSQIVITGTL